jgi:hypothetical protein
MEYAQCISAAQVSSSFYLLVDIFSKIHSLNNAELDLPPGVTQKVKTLVAVD